MWAHAKHDGIAAARLFVVNDLCLAVCSGNQKKVLFLEIIFK